MRRFLGERIGPSDNPASSQFIYPPGENIPSGVRSGPDFPGRLSSKEPIVQRTPNLPAMFIGATLILAPLGINFAASENDKSRAVDFYRSNPSGATLPEALESSKNVSYQWACFGIGTGIAFAGLNGRKACGTAKPKAWEHAEV